MSSGDGGKAQRERAKGDAPLDLASITNAATAQEKRADAEVQRGGEAGDPPDPDCQFTSLTAHCADEYRANLKANRGFRRLIFFCVGGGAVAFFALLFVRLCQFTSVAFANLSATENSAPTFTAIDWHAYIFYGVVLLILSAIPLSLVMALIKMVKDSGVGDSEDDPAVRTPAFELGKVISETISGIVSNKQGG